VWHGRWRQRKNVIRGCHDAVVREIEIALSFLLTFLASRKKLHFCIERSMPDNILARIHLRPFFGAPMQGVGAPFHKGNHRGAA